MKTYPISSSLILVANNDQIQRETIVKILKKESYEVFEAVNPQTLFETLRQYPIEILLVNLDVPGLDRYELAQTVKQHPAQIEMIFISDHNGIEQLFETMPNEFYGFLRVPFKRFDLLFLIQKALEHRRLVTQNKRLAEEAELLKEHNPLLESSTQKYVSLYKKFKLIYSAFEHSTDAILITDLSGKILEINHAFTRLFGYSPEELIGETTKILRSDKSEDLLFQKMWEEINSKGEWRGEIVNKSRDGVEIPVWLIITPILDEGKKIGYMGIEIDLREKKKIDERLLYMGRLATIGKISAQMVHEIRNPLSSMSLNLELLLEELESYKKEDTREAKHLIASITAEIDRLSTVNEEYLAFARLPKFSPQKTQINTLLQHLQELCALESNKQQISIELSLSSIPAIYADENQLRQAFLNLIKNAMEAMPEGGLLKISTKLNENNEIEIRFEDTGYGIEETMIQQIFDPFFTTKDKGTGLGLSVTLQIIEEHRGQIECKSSLGKGSTFLIRIPLLLNKP